MAEEIIEGMGLKRRTFLQQAGLALLTLGVSETLLAALLGNKSLAMPLLDRYYQALAQPSSRKLALLVGINQYPRSGETRNVLPLQGCVTDVELQRELLIHRFGFNPSDILTLTDQQATRQNIETAFLEHLSNQATAGDVVLFHFSGYGSRINISAESEVNSEVPIQNSLVPVDGIVPTKGTLMVNNLLEGTLLLLLRSLSTDHITTVLDTSYADADKILQGNLRIRSRPEISAEQLSPEELAFQEKLLLRLNTSWEQIEKHKRLSQMPGIVLTASAPTQPATEAPWGGFSAGLFTYALTQYLWQSTPQTTVQVSFNQAAVVVEQVAGKDQQPQLSGRKSQEHSLLTYNLSPDRSMGADGVVIAVEDNGKTAQLWLAGLPTRLLADYGVHSVVTLLNFGTEKDSNVSVESISKPLQLQIRARDGLMAKARLINTDTVETSPLQVGQLVQESLRVLPRNVGLILALDSRLKRIERVDATSAFASVPCVLSVVAAGEQPADYLFGKVLSAETIAEREDLTQDSKGGYGLFSLSGNPIPNTVGEAGEAVKSAVNRLKPKLKTLLAAKLWRLSVNEESSRLGVEATLEMVSPREKVVMQRTTLRVPKVEGNKKDSSRNLSGQGIPNIPSGSRIQYRIKNYSDRPIYFVLLGLDSSSNAIALYTPLLSSSESDISETKPLLTDAVIPPGQTLIVPQPATSDQWVIQAPPGLAETYLICSISPFTQSLAALKATMPPKGEQQRIDDLLNPLDVARGVLQDLHQASRFSSDTLVISPETYALDVNAWATFSFVYQVI